MSDTEKKDLLAEPINKALVPASESIGNTLKDLWDLAFGGFGNYVEKKRLTRQKNLEDFREALYGKVAEIPNERLQEPPLSIVGPAMESSKYYFEEPTIREMFANLISASIDSNYNDEIHPCFTSIIQQLSALDAQNLMLIEINLPIAQYRMTHRFKNSYKIAMTNVFLSNPDMQDIEQQSKSISVLERLGLITVTYLSHLNMDSGYDAFSETPLFREIQEDLDDEDWYADIKQGSIHITPLGRAFKDVCLR